MFELTNRYTNVVFMFNLTPILVISVLIIFIYLDKLHTSNNRYFGFNYFTILPVIFLIKFLNYVDNILVLLVIIELINYIFYFQFLNFFSKHSKNTKNKQFDAILIYFWSTFFSLIIIVV